KRLRSRQSWPTDSRGPAVTAVRCQQQFRLLSGSSGERGGGVAWFSYLRRAPNVRLRTSTISNFDSLLELPEIGFLVSSPLGLSYPGLCGSIMVLNVVRAPISSKPV